MSSTCPICSAACSPSGENRFFPFCSQRCQLVDLGRWLSEDYRFSEPLSDADVDGLEGDDAGGLDELC